MATKSGDMTICMVCGAEYVATKGGEGTVTCCGKPVEPKRGAKGKGGD